MTDFSSLQHAEGSPEARVADHIGGHKHPPCMHIRPPLAFQLALHFLNRKKNSGLYQWLESSDRSVRKRRGKQSSTGPVEFRIDAIE